jgi:hypothetical protein
LRMAACGARRGRPRADRHSGARNGVGLRRQKRRGQDWRNANEHSRRAGEHQRTKARHRNTHGILLQDLNTAEHARGRGDGRV